MPFLLEARVLLAAGRLVGPYLAPAHGGCQGQTRLGRAGASVAAEVGRDLHPVATDGHRAPPPPTGPGPVAEVQHAPRVGALADLDAPTRDGQIGHGPGHRAEDAEGTGRAGRESQAPPGVLAQQPGGAGSPARAPRSPRRPSRRAGTACAPWRRAWPGSSRGAAAPEQRPRRSAARPSRPWPAAGHRRRVRPRHGARENRRGRPRSGASRRARPASGRCWRSRPPGHRRS